MAALHHLAEWLLLAKHRGYDQYEVGAQAGYEKTHFNKIVTGGVRLSRDKCRNIAEALTKILGQPVRPDDLFSVPRISFSQVDAGEKAVIVNEPAGGVPVQHGDEAMLESARPLIRGLVETFGLEVLMEEAVRAKQEIEAKKRPSSRTGTE